MSTHFAFWVDNCFFTTKNRDVFARHSAVHVPKTVRKITPMHQKRDMQNTPNLPLVPKTVHKKHPVYRFRYLKFGVFCSKIRCFSLDLISDFLIRVILSILFYTLTLSILPNIFPIFDLIFAFGFSRFSPLYLLSIFAKKSYSTLCHKAYFLHFLLAQRSVVIVRFYACDAVYDAHSVHYFAKSRILSVKKFRIGMADKKL